MNLTPEGSSFYEYVSAGCAVFFKGENKSLNNSTTDYVNALSPFNGIAIYTVKNTIFLKS